MDENEDVEEESNSLPRFFLRGRGKYSVILGLKGKRCATDAPVAIKAKVKPLFGGKEYVVEKDTTCNVVEDTEEHPVVEEESYDE